MTAHHHQHQQEEEAMATTSTMTMNRRNDGNSRRRRRTNHDCVCEHPRWHVLLLLFMLMSTATTTTTTTFSSSSSSSSWSSPPGTSKNRRQRHHHEPRQEHQKIIAFTTTSSIRKPLSSSSSFTITARRQRPIPLLQQKSILFLNEPRLVLSYPRAAAATANTSRSSNSPLYMFLGGVLNRNSTKRNSDDKNKSDDSSDTDQTNNVITTTTTTTDDATTQENLVIPTEIIQDSNIMIKVNGENTNESVFEKDDDNVVHENDESDLDVDQYCITSSSKPLLSSSDPSITSNPSRRSSLFWNSKHKHEEEEEEETLHPQEIMSEEDDDDEESTEEQEETNSNHDKNGNLNDNAIVDDNDNNDPTTTTIIDTTKPKEDRATRTKRRRRLVVLGRKRALKKMLREAREEKRFLKQQQQMVEEKARLAKTSNMDETGDTDQKTKKVDTTTTNEKETTKQEEMNNITQTKSSSKTNSENQLVNITNIDELHQAVLVDGVEIKNLIYLPKGHGVEANNESTTISTTTSTEVDADIDDSVAATTDQSSTDDTSTSMMVEETLHPVLDLISQRYQEESVPGHRSQDDKSILAMSIEGGGMRGAVSAGMASAIACLGLADTFDEVYGSSAGSIVGAYFVSRQMCIDVYTEILPLASTQFVCKKRLMGNLVYQLSKDVASKASTNVKYYLNRTSKAKKKTKNDEPTTNDKQDNKIIKEDDKNDNDIDDAAFSNANDGEEFDNYSELYDNVFQLSEDDDDDEEEEEETTSKRRKKGGRLRRLIGLGRRRSDNTDEDGNIKKGEEFNAINTDNDTNDDDDEEEPSWIHEAAEEVAAEELLEEEKTSSSSSSSSSSSTNSFWGFSSLVSRLGSVMKPVTSPLKYVSSTPGMNITFVLDGIMCSQSKGLRPLDLKVFQHNHQYQPLRVIASGVSTQTNQMVTAVLGLEDSDFFDSTDDNTPSSSSSTTGVTFCSLTKRRGLFACLAASMSVPGATGAPIYLNQPTSTNMDSNNNGKLKDNNNNNDNNIQSTTTTDILKCFDAFCYEPMPYRSAVYPPSSSDRKSATHVLVLRTRPDKCDVATKPTLYERVIAPLYFRQHDMPQVANYFLTGGQQYRYLEDVLTLQKGLLTKQKIPIPPTDIVVGIDDENDDDEEKQSSMSCSSSINSSNKDEIEATFTEEQQGSSPINLKDPSTWRTAYMYPLTLPSSSVELSTVSTDQQEVLEAVRDGFTVAFELLAPIVGVNLTNFAILEDELEETEVESITEDNETGPTLETNTTRKNATTATDVARQIAELVFPDTSVGNDEVEVGTENQEEIEQKNDKDDNDNNNKKIKKNAAVASAALLWEHLEPLHVQGELISVPSPSKPSLLSAVMGGDDNDAASVANHDEDGDSTLKKDLLLEDDEEVQLLQQWWTSGGGTSPPQSLFKVGRWLDSMTENRRRTDRTHLRKKLMHPKRMIQVARRNFKYMHPREKLLLGIGGIISLASLRELQRQYLLNDVDTTSSTNDMNDDSLLLEAMSDESSNQDHEEEELLLLDSLISDSLQIQNVAASTTNQEPIPLSKETLLTYLPGLREGKLSHLSKHLRDV